MLKTTQSIPQPASSHQAETFTPRRSVHFSDTVAIDGDRQENFEITFDEVAALWFSRDELLEIKKSVFIDMMGAPIEGRKSKPRRRWSMLGKTPQSTIATQSIAHSTNIAAAAAATAKNPSGSGDFCSRGVEHLISFEIQQHQLEIRRNVVEAVIREQRWQAQRQESDSVAVANASAYYSWRSRDMAIKLAAQDAKDAEVGNVKGFTVHESTSPLSSSLTSGLTNKEGIRVTQLFPRAMRRSSMPLSSAKNSVSRTVFNP